MYTLDRETYLKNSKIGNDTPRIVSLEDAIARAAFISNPDAASIQVFLEEYTQVEIDSVGGVELTNIEAIPGVLVAMNHMNYENKSSIEQTQILKTTNSTTNTVSTSTTLGFKYKLEISAKAGFPGIAEVSGSTEYELSYSKTTQNINSQTEEFSDETPIKVPPHTTVDASFLVYDMTASPNFSQKLRIKAISGDYSPEKEGFKVCICVKFHIFPNYKPDEYYYHSLGGWLRRLPEFEYVSPNEVNFTVKGKIASVNGKNFKTQVKESDYKSKEITKISHIFNEGDTIKSKIFDISLEAVGKPSDNVE